MKTNIWNMKQQNVEKNMTDICSRVSGPTNGGKKLDGKIVSSAFPDTHPVPVSHIRPGRFSSVDAVSHRRWQMWKGRY